MTDGCTYTITDGTHLTLVVKSIATENSSKLTKIDKNLMKTKLFLTKIILVTLKGINVNKIHF